MLGADYEIFVMNGHTHMPIPSYNFELGGKREPHKPLFSVNNPDQQIGSIHKDNLMLEACIHPAATYQEFALNVSGTLQAVQKFVTDRNADWTVSKAPAAVFRDSECATREGYDIGCDQDFLSLRYASVGRDRVTAKALGNLRCAGGHMHISYDVDLVPPWAAAMLFDLIVAMPNRHKLNVDRAPYYGIASLHRPTQYPNGTFGVEYRVLDSWWVHAPDMAVIKPLGLVQALLTAKYMDATRQLVELHMRAVPERVVIAHFDGDAIKEDVRQLIHTLAADLEEEYNDSI